MTQGRESFTKGRGVLVVLLLVVIFAGWGVLDNGFVNYDDPQLLLYPGAAGKLLPTYGNLADWLLHSVSAAWLPLRFLLFSFIYSLVGPVAWALKVLFAYAGSFLVPVDLSVRYLVKVPLEILRADRYAFTLVPVFAVGLAYGLRSISLSGAIRLLRERATSRLWRQIQTRWRL